MKKSLLILLLTVSSTLFSQSRIYVDVDATGNNNGTSWADAYTSLTSAIDSAASGDTLWVAEGNYVPTIGFSFPGAFPFFDIYRPLKLYGGFQGNETHLNQRDYINHVTILNGDINGDDNYNGYPFNPSNPTRDDNSPRVVWVSGNNVVIDGFSIRNGHSTLSAGSGVYVDGTSIYNFKLSNCEFSYNFNSSINAGVQIDVKNNTDIEISNNRFQYNSANTATGIYVYTSSPSINVDLDIVNNLFSNQRIEAIGNRFSGSAGWVRAYENGSVINLNLVNNTFTKNYISVPTTIGRVSTIFGVSVFSANTSGAMNTNVVNNIFWDNIDSDQLVPAEISSIINNGSSIGSMLTSSPNIAEDQLSYLTGSPGTASNPLFVNPANNDFSLSSTSPALDAGDSLFVVGKTDVFGNARMFNATVDLGAVEYQSTVSVKEYLDENIFTIYPNPTNGLINIDSERFSSVEVYSINGAFILKSTSKKFDIRSQPAGVYVLKILSDDNQFIYKRIVKE